MANAIKTPNAIAAILVTGALGIVSFAGCNQSVQKTIVKQPAPTPVPTVAVALAELPLPKSNSQLLRLLPGDTRPLSEILIEQVQADYDAGKKESAAGHEDEAQAD